MEHLIEIMVAVVIITAIIGFALLWWLRRSLKEDDRQRSKQEHLRQRELWRASPAYKLQRAEVGSYFWLKGKRWQVISCLTVRWQDGSFETRFALQQGDRHLWLVIRNDHLVSVWQELEVVDLPPKGFMYDTQRLRKRKQYDGTYRRFTGGCRPSSEGMLRRVEYKSAEQVHFIAEQLAPTARWTLSRGWDSKSDDPVLEA